MSIETVGGVAATPELLAHLFWEMDTDEQVRFFAALDDVAGHVLCMQMAHLVNAITESTDKRDCRAMNAFRTMFCHAEEYAKTATDWRAFLAKNEINRTVRAAKKGLGLVDA